jgi:hypothetical protein
VRGSWHHSLAERDNGLAGQEEDWDVDTGDVFPRPVSKGFVEMVSILLTQVPRRGFLRRLPPKEKVDALRHMLG